MSRFCPLPCASATTISVAPAARAALTAASASRHELPKSAVLEPGWSKLLAGHGARDALHVDRDEYFQARRLALIAHRRDAPRTGEHEHRSGNAPSEKHD